MVRALQHRVLLIGDSRGQLRHALGQALPEAHVRSAPSVFDGIAELAQDHYTSVLIAAEPVSARPVAAMRALRELAGSGRLVLYGDASTEPLSMRMMKFGCDDYLVTPVESHELQEALGTGEAPLRSRAEAEAPRPAPVPVAPQPPAAIAPTPAPFIPPSNTASPMPAPAPVVETPNSPPAIAAAEIISAALLEQPGEAVAFAISQLNARSVGGIVWSMVPPTSSAPAGPLVLALKNAAGGAAGWIHLTAPQGQESAAQSLLDQVGPWLTRAFAIQNRHNRLGKLAFTDDLTGIFNCRYFKHFLSRKLIEARKARFPVTLFLFDIDNFKSYNDRFGHSVGDDILKQVSSLMRRCVRDHDLVARIGGDEFAVVFWEKDAPRQARSDGKPTPQDGKPSPESTNGIPGLPGRPPSEPEQILARFRRMLESTAYPKLGSTGQGTLTISGGLAVFPYDAHDVESLVDAADKALMFGAKRAGRNSIQIVGGS